MEIENYNKASAIQSVISMLSGKLRILKGYRSADSLSSIEFHEQSSAVGKSSAYITFDEDISDELLSNAISLIEKKIERLKKEFEDL